jgi:hypothetical protein
MVHAAEQAMQGRVMEGRWGVVLLLLVIWTHR